MPGSALRAGVHVMMRQANLSMPARTLYPEGKRAPPPRKEADKLFPNAPCGQVLYLVTAVCPETEQRLVPRRFQ